MLFHVMPRRTSFQRLLSMIPGIFPVAPGGLIPDIVAGISLAAMNIPQAMGYARLAGVPVIAGLYTLLFPVMAFAFLGASRYLFVGADSATAVILAAGIAPLAEPGTASFLAHASVVALLTVVALLLARVLRLGFLADFLSRTVLIGFLTGVGIQVGIAELGPMSGITVSGTSALEQLAATVKNITHFHGTTLLLSAVMVTLIFVTKRFTPKVPGTLIAVLGSIALSGFLDLKNHGIPVIGPVAGGLPPLGLPNVSWSDIPARVPIAGACFVMIITQSSATARAFATKHHLGLDENRDLLGLAASNALAGLTGTFVVNGSPTQTAMLETCGGKSQIANLATAATVAVILLLFTGPLKFLPLCVLGAIIFVVAVGMIDLSGFRNLWRCRRKEFFVALFTSVSVVALGVGYGIWIALILSLLEHVQHGYQPHTAVIVRDPVEHWRMEPVVPGPMIEPGVVMYWFGADLYYANVHRFAAQVRSLAEDSSEKTRVVAVDVSAITSMDYSAGREVIELQQYLAKRGVILAMARVNEALQEDMNRQHVTEAIGVRNIFRSRKHCLEAYRDEAGADPAGYPPRARS